jgi:hypothetical protein
MQIMICTLLIEFHSEITNLPTRFHTRKGPAIIEISEKYQIIYCIVS